MTDKKHKILEAKNIRISFRTNNGTVKAVRDVSFDLYRGETLAIVGESGSGKSVTAKAIMGILAQNSIIEDGEIIYDGKDLLKISEDEFHELRGMRLSMIFQDPLSSLNPIMRVGRQMTEAMILNSKGRRRESRKSLLRKLKQLTEAIENGYKAQEGGKSKKEIVAQIAEYRRITDHAIKLRTRYHRSKAAIDDALGAIEDLEIALITNDVTQVRDVLSELSETTGLINDPYLITAADTAMQSIRKQMTKLKSKYVASDRDSVKRLSAELKAMLNRADAYTEPSFSAIGYLILKGENITAQPEEIKALNERGNQALQQGFMDNFHKDIEVGLRYAHEKSQEGRREALPVLQKLRPIFENQNLTDRKVVERAVKEMSDAVENGIDRLTLQKDNLSYIFRSSMNEAIKRYFKGVENNPKEQARVERETAKRERDIAKGKIVSSVVPPMIIDTERAHQKMVETVKTLETLYNTEDGIQIDFSQRATEMEERLEKLSTAIAERLSIQSAHRKALALMEEVGIPEPRKRYKQFPFEFSGGMRQRVVIAIALSANPEILICDEPTTALDVTIQAQILELINELKIKRNLSVIFITHDLGVVANMADRIAVMYAGKIVEYGTTDDVFYDPRHPYTWALLSSMPDLETKERLNSIPGAPPNMIIPPVGDAFAFRNRYALKIDFEQHPPFFKVTDTHYAATWLMHPDAPEVAPPAIVTERIERMKRKEQMEAERND